MKWINANERLPLPAGKVVCIKYGDSYYSGYRNHDSVHPAMYIDMRTSTKLTRDCEWLDEAVSIQPDTADVLCCQCNKPIKETGTAFNGKPCHIACFYHLKSDDKYPGEGDNDLKDLIIHGITEGSQQWEAESKEWKLKYEKLISSLPSESFTKEQMEGLVTHCDHHFVEPIIEKTPKQIVDDYLNSLTNKQQ